MRTNIKLAAGAISTLCLCWFVGQQLKQTREEMPEPPADSELNWSLLDHLDSEETILYGRIESDDYPFGYNIGLIDDEEAGQSILLTPNTKLSFHCEIQDGSFLYLGHQIHPWVSGDSDGALLYITAISENTRQEYVLDTGEEFRSETISLAQFGNCEVQFDLTIANEDGKNENCDWVIIRQFDLSTREP